MVRTEVMATIVWSVFGMSKSPVFLPKTIAYPYVCTIVGTLHAWCMIRLRGCGLSKRIRIPSPHFMNL